MNYKPSGLDVYANPCTEKNARSLANRIARYWKDRGASVQMEVFPEGRNFVVRSDMINGYPLYRSMVKGIKS